jgi:hypothetical protein
MRLIRIAILAVSVSLLAAVTIAASQPPPPQPAQEEFIPLDQLPPEAQLPAAPMVIAAYVFVWVAFVVYIFTVVKRIRKVEVDLRALENRTAVEPRR